jgi:aryl-alcohol dehydrogenase-like predicted oxidoreductase
MTRERIENLPSDDWRARGARVREPELSRKHALVERVRQLAERPNVSAGAVAVAWTLRHTAVDGAIVGFRKPGQVDPMLPAADLELAEDDLELLGGA